MRKTTLACAFIVLCCAGFGNAQNSPDKKLFEVQGVVRDRRQVELSGLRLDFKSGNQSAPEWTVSDENGKFSVRLPAGKYEITVNRLISEKFIAFIEISETNPNLNPNNFELTIDLSDECCARTSGGEKTRVVKYVAPPFPPAARAVRAGGDVVISVRIGKDGKVVSAKIESGHPLLVQAAIGAAKQWIFTSDEAAADDSEREGRIIFAFSLPEKAARASRFKEPNRLEVFAAPPTIDISTGTAGR